MAHRRMQAFVVAATIVLGGVAAGAYREVPVTDGVAITGRVHVRGDVEVHERRSLRNRHGGCLSPEL